jgi:hypothetical protein
MRGVKSPNASKIYLGSDEVGMVSGAAIAKTANG